MKNGIEERKDGRKERSKKDRDFEQIYIYQARRIRQNIENKPDVRVEYRD